MQIGVFFNYLCYNCRSGENMKICVLASGSKGNCTYIEAGNTRILIDAGISKKRLLEVLEKNKINYDKIDAILVTHEHVDHVSGLGAILKFFGCGLYITKRTHQYLEEKYKDKISCSNVIYVANDEEFKINDVIIRTIPIFHDACDPVAFIVEHNDKKIVYITDTGYVHQKHLEAISNADVYVFECNHDPEILMNSDRPYQTKMRILGNHGHLSNEDALYILSQVIGNRTKRVFYAHISEECNLYEIIELTSKRVFSSIGVDVSEIDFIYTSQSSTKVEEV